MRYFIQFAAALPVCLSMSLAAAQDKVVVIPLNSAKKLNNVVTVSAKGGDFTDPVAAVNSIADATSAKPYLVLIGPGVYTITQTLIMKPFVTMAGSGQELTTLTGTISSGQPDKTSAIVSGADNSTLHDLTIENKGGGVYSIGLINPDYGSSPSIIDVTASASGGNFNYGVLNAGSSSSLINVTASASGGASSTGVQNGVLPQIMTNVTATASGGTDKNCGVNNLGSSSIMTDVTATASGGTDSYGIYNSFASPSMTDVSAKASGAVHNYGVFNTLSSSPVMTNVFATGTGGTTSYGVNHHSSSTMTIQHSRLEGGSNGIYVDQGIVHVLHSSILGGAYSNPTAITLTCVYSDNETAPLNSSCQVPP